ncbi:CidA/LrgA family protein [Anaerobacillus sp. HL2]|nr:CidA/LrgA family protein [Anaerobacillus sp. HL2]
MFHVPVPGNVLGMVILFSLLMSGAVSISGLRKHLLF